MDSVRRLKFAAIVAALTSCASADQAPTTRPAGYETYALPAECANPAAAKTVPHPINYDEIRRLASFRFSNRFPQDGPRQTVFLWYFIRESGTVADVRLWRPGPSPEINNMAMDLGSEMRWRPATCDGQAIAGWYGHPISLGGRDG